MQSATHSIRSLRINGMDNDSCIKKVTHALKGINDIKTKSVSLGSAKIDADQTGCDAACRAVSAIGYETHEVKPSQKDAVKAVSTSTALNKQTSASQAAARAVEQNR